MPSGTQLHPHFDFLSPSKHCPAICLLPAEVIRSWLPPHPHPHFVQSDNSTLLNPTPKCVVSTGITHNSNLCPIINPKLLLPLLVPRSALIRQLFIMVNMKSWPSFWVWNRANDSQSVTASRHVRKGGTQDFLSFQTTPFPFCFSHL